MTSSLVVALSDPIETISMPVPRRRPKLVFLVTEDWYFWSHRLALARAARDAGWEVVVATRVRAHGEAIRDAGFRLRPIDWRRRGDGLFGALRAILEIARLYRAERPDLVHHVALKPVVFGGLARRLAFPRRRDGPRRIDAVMGLGSGFSRKGLGAQLRRPLLRLALGRLGGERGGRIIVQNAGDAAALAGFGVAQARIALIRGSGVDLARFQPLCEPEGEGVTVALVARMLRDKGVLDAVAAVRRLRERGLAVSLLLAGPPDPDNEGSLDAAALEALAREPGIEWLGQVEDVRQVWRRAAIAVLPTTYGEGLPKALIEAAACARPVVATDVAGCREIVVPGETGMLVPPHDVEALAAALAGLARDRAGRRRMGAAGRALVERSFAEGIVVRQTLALYEALMREPR
ncbi:MAG TPA: glycosyltransferase family 4 protein [Stellaceae bacterium]|nr:glycosyltransferase family 4 protein [Stellaceae bacterium]